MDRLLEELSSVCATVQVDAFASLLTVLRDYCGDHDPQNEDDSVFFPSHIFLKVLERALNISDIAAATVMNALLIKALMRYVDLYFYTLKTFSLILNKDGSPERASKIFAILRNVPFKTVEELTTAESLLSYAKGADSKFRNLSKLKTEFSACVLAIVAHLPERDHRKFVSHVGTNIIPNMSQPHVLSDFLSRVYKQGGTEAILALDGLFVLIRDYNLDFPKFYDHLYALIDEKILHLRSDKAKFFKYLAVFMSSSMLPAYVVAGIVKRVARLCIYATPSIIIWSLSFIYNMLLQYPACRQLIHREQMDPLLDPYIVTTNTLSECRALDSSLWELRALESHSWPKISKLCLLLKEKFTKSPFDLESLSQETDLDLYRNVIQGDLSHRWSRRPPTEINIPDTLF